MSEQTFIIVGASLAGREGRRGAARAGFRRTGCPDRLRARAAVRATAADQGLPAWRVCRARRPMCTRTASTLSSDIELETGTTVTAIDPVAVAGHACRWPRAPLTTGCCLRPARSRVGFRVPGADLDGIHYLRTLADCDIAARPARWRGPRGGCRGGLDRQRVRRLGTPARPRGHAHRSALAAQRADLRCRDRRLLPRRARTARHRAGARRGRRGVRGRRRRSRACAPPAAGRSSATSPSSASASCRASSSPAAPAWRSTTASSSTRSCRPRRRASSPPATWPERLASLLRRADPRRALGERAQPGPRRGTGDARRAGQLRPHPLLLLRPVRGRDGVLGLRAQMG